MASFIARTISRIRDATDEPSTNAKWTDTKLLDLIEIAYAKTLADVNRVSQRPVIVRFDLTVTASVDKYVLPPVIGRIMAMQYVDSNDVVLKNYYPGDGRHPSYSGLSIEGNVVYFQDVDQAAHTLRIMFVPINCIKLHTHTILGTGIANSTANNNAVITLPTAVSITTGSLDSRPNAYVGSVFRINSVSEAARDFSQDRVITAYDVTTRKATVEPAYTAALLPGDADTVTYEIAPILTEQLDIAIALYVARYIVGVEGDRDRYRIIDTEYVRTAREVRLNEAHYNMIQGHVMKTMPILSRRSTGRY